MTLDELLKNELNHEEPPWRTPVTKGWRDKMKDERIDERYDDLDEGSDEMAEEIELREKNDDNTWNQEFIPQEQTPKKKGLLTLMK